MVRGGSYVAPADDCAYIRVCVRLKVVVEMRIVGQCLVRRAVAVVVEGVERRADRLMLAGEDCGGVALEAPRMHVAYRRASFADALGLRIDANST